MALWDSEKTHCSSPSFVSNGNWRGGDMLWTSYWISETKLEAENYWKNIHIRYMQLLLFIFNIVLLLFLTFFLRLEKSHVVGKVIMAIQWDHDILHFLPNWHKTIRLLYCSIFFHHRRPFTDYLTDTLLFGAEKYKRNTLWCSSIFMIVYCSKTQNYHYELNFVQMLWKICMNMLISINISSADKTKK